MDHALYHCVTLLQNADSIYRQEQSPLQFLASLLVQHTSRFHALTLVLQLTRD